MFVRDLESTLLARFPRRDAEAWDHVGLSVGDPDAEVRGVLCSLDATLDSLHTACSLGCNVLLTHHPVYISAPDSFCPPSAERPSSSSVVYEAVRLGVSVISLHTNLDRSREARASLPGLLGMEARSSLEYPNDPDATGLGSLCTCDPITLDDLAVRLRDTFETAPTVWGDPKMAVSRLAFIGGSLGDFGEPAIGAGADVVVTGEVGYHRAQDLSLRGMGVVALGHDRSEQPFCSILADACASIGVPAEHIYVNPLPTQWWVPTQGDFA